MPDYSEFPTTPTAWQEEHARGWETVTALETEDPAPPKQRKVDLVALVPGVLFAVLALILMTGVELPEMFFDGGPFWVVLIGVGIALLVSELRKARRSR